MERSGRYSCMWWDGVCLCCSRQILLLADCDNSSCVCVCVILLIPDTTTLLMWDAVSYSPLHRSSSPSNFLFFSSMLIPLFLLSYLPLPSPILQLLPSPCTLFILFSTLPCSPSPPPYSLPSFFSSLPRFDPSLHPSLRPAGSAGTEAAFVSAVSSILWRRKAEKRGAGRGRGKTWSVDREKNRSGEMG